MSGHSNKRERVSFVFEDSVLIELKSELGRRLREKGRGTFSSKHELLGIITEEYLEVQCAVQSKGDVDHIKLRAELLDVAVACVFGVACIDAKTMDW